MAPGNRQQSATGRGSGEAPWQGLTTGHHGLGLPVVLGVASAFGLLLSYLEIGPTAFRIAIFCCIISGFVAALFQRRSQVQAEQVVAGERRERLDAARELREELASLREVVARGADMDLSPLQSELASLSGKVHALEQSQTTFRDSLVQEMNPGRGRRRGRARDRDAPADGMSGIAANGVTGYVPSGAVQTTPGLAAASYEPPSHEPPAHASGPYGSATYPAASYEPPSYEHPSYQQPAYETAGYSVNDDPALVRRSWSGADAMSGRVSDDADTAAYAPADYSGYDTADQPTADTASADHRLAEIFPANERGYETGTNRPSWTAGAATNGVENGTGRGAANGFPPAVNGMATNDAVHGGVSAAGTSAFTEAGDHSGRPSAGRSALWESSAASRLAPPGGAAPAAARSPWETESTGLPPRPTTVDRSAAAAWDPQGAEQRGRTSWSVATDSPERDDQAWTGPGSAVPPSTGQPSDDEDAVAAAARFGSPRRGRPSDEDPHEVTQTQRLSASEQTAIRRRFLDLSSMDDDGWPSRGR